MSELLFICSASDPAIQKVNGYVEILWELGSDKRDWEVGRMFHIKNKSNGYETDAFADELTVVRN